MVIGHHDAAPWNAVWHAGELVGFFDWDTAGPSSREFDLAFMALSWVPLHARRLAARTGFTAFEDRRRRLHLLLDAYGYDGDRSAFGDVVAARARTNADVIDRMAAGGDPAYAALGPVVRRSPPSRHRGRGVDPILLVPRRRLGHWRISNRAPPTQAGASVGARESRAQDHSRNCGQSQCQLRRAATLPGRRSNCLCTTSPTTAKPSGSSGAPPTWTGARSVS
ncbi:phosphotransferase [Streptomyces sp. NPDC003032]